MSNVHDLLHQLFIKILKPITKINVLIPFRRRVPTRFKLSQIPIPVAGKDSRNNSNNLFKGICTSHFSQVTDVKKSASHEQDMAPIC